MSHTEKLTKELQGFELYILNHYDKFMEQERVDDQEYATGITYHDSIEDFYAWLDMQDWDTMKQWVEDYAQEVKAIQ